MNPQVRGHKLTSLKPVSYYRNTGTGLCTDHVTSVCDEDPLTNAVMTSTHS